MVAETDEIVWLRDIALEDRSRVGTKAAILGALRAAGLPVPDGYCIPAGKRLDLDIDEDLWTAILGGYRQLVSDGGDVAVRSSGVAEDSPHNSYAGQYETVLNVDTVDALVDAIRMCWQSARSLRVQAYERSRQGGGEPGRLPLVVQRQVPASTSGVLFTRDPVTGSDEAMLIEAVAGLGEGLVSGHTRPTRYSVDRLQRVGPMQTDGEEEALLTTEQCRMLADLARRIEDILGAGQDIEWAWDGEQFHILQARPITGKRASYPLSAIWTRANIGEVLPDVITPLTWQIFRATLLHDPKLAVQDCGDAWGETEGIRRFHGRAYVRMDGLLHSFCYLPTVTPAVMQQVLGVVIPPAAQPYEPPHGVLVRLAQAMFLADALRLLPRLRWLVPRLPALPASGAMSALDAPARLDRLISWTAECFQLHLKCTAYAIGGFSLISRLLRQWLPDRAEDLLPRVMLGHEDLQTAAQGLSLQALARQVGENPALLDRIGSGSDWSTVVGDLSNVPGGETFLGALRVFLQANGARAIKEFELAVPRWREDPSFLLDVIVKLVQSGPLKTATESDPTQRRQEALDEIYGACGPVRRWILRRLLSSYGDYTTWRENVKYHLMEGYEALRHVFVGLGDDLVSGGTIERVDDVFFLTPCEIVEHLHEDQSSLSGRVQDRRERHAMWSARVCPDLIVGDGQEIGRFDGDELAGIGCSPGIVRGIARVLLDSTEASQLRPGEILVAPHTDPGWTPLFLTCGAVVTEIGGFLSHGATVAREYGIPAVMNVTGATAEIQTGDLVQVDGGSGVVTLFPNS